MNFGFMVSRSARSGVRGKAERMSSRHHIPSQTWNFGIAGVTHDVIPKIWSLINKPRQNHIEVASLVTVNKQALCIIVSTKHRRFRF